MYMKLVTKESHGAGLVFKHIQIIHQVHASLESRHNDVP